LAGKSRKALYVPKEYAVEGIFFQDGFQNGTQCIRIQLIIIRPFDASQGFQETSSALATNPSSFDLDADYGHTHLNLPPTAQSTPVNRRHSPNREHKLSEAPR